MKDTDSLTFDNIGQLGFEYNYFEGFTYKHKDGYTISVYDAQRVHYKGKWIDCKTVGDFKNMLNNT